MEDSYDFFGNPYSSLDILDKIEYDDTKYKKIFKTNDEYPVLPSIITKFCEIENIPRGLYFLSNTDSSDPEDKNGDLEIKYWKYSDFD